MSSTQPRMADILANCPATGQVEWIGLRPGRGEPINKAETVEVTADEDLVGDRLQGINEM